VDATPAVLALARFRRPFLSPQSWAVGEQYWIETRSAMAEAIEALAWLSGPGAVLRVR
jgi:hypothetical protein